jgi:hypothetical protein
MAGPACATERPASNTPQLCLCATHTRRTWPDVEREIARIEAALQQLREFHRWQQMNAVEERQ